MLGLANIENTIIEGDSTEILTRFPSESVDLIITDPVWPGASVDLPGSDDPVGILCRTAKEFSRITKRVIIHLGQKTDPRVLTCIPLDLPFVQVCWLKWVPCMYHGPILVSADVAYVFGHKRLPGDGSRVLGAEHTNVWNPKKTEDARFDPDNNHPCPRSLDHVSWLVRRFSLPGDLILDPFCGSGTTCLAAKLAGRRYCGIDISGEYVKYARQRLSKPDLFG